MALVIIYAVLSHFDFVAKFTVKNLNKDFTNTGRGVGGHHFMKVFHKTEVFFKGWLPLKEEKENNEDNSHMQVADGWRQQPPRPHWGQECSA